MATGTINRPYQSYGLGASVGISDANDAVDNGWYAAARTASNLPATEPCVIFVARRSDSLVQEAWTFDTRKKYHRFKYGASWLGWVNDY